MKTLICVWVFWGLWRIYDTKQNSILTLIAEDSYQIRIDLEISTVYRVESLLKKEKIQQMFGIS